MQTKKTKIVCTLGPSSDSVSEITELQNAGMNVARLNFSHGTYKHHKHIIDNLRKVEKKSGKLIGILQDLQGPKIRIGEMGEGFKIKKGEVITLTVKKIKGYRDSKKGAIIPIQYKNIIKDTKPKDIILINDGLLEIQITKKSRTELKCKVKVGGLVESRKGVNVPTASISAPAITSKDKKDLKWGLKQNVDYVALSFVKSKKDIQELRRLIKKHKSDAKIVAKIERHEAVDNLKEIIKESDAIMVARGDLGIEIPAERVPIVQKKIIKLANKYGKAVITATQVLQSMVENSRATRAEISDAANAVFDHTDAIMLSNESAIGKYAHKATLTLKKVALSVENEMQLHEEIIELLDSARQSSSLNPTCRNAAELAIDSEADYIAVYTKEGFTAREIAKSRISIPIITITPDTQTARELTLVWGINRLLIANLSGQGSKKTESIVKLLKSKKLIKKKSKLIIVCNTSHKEKLISKYQT
ncbi:pyruvate kinase [Candidatus Peregrinibacteria bacterium]|nr:pyruvate kinase [Candidatus Peregrinibacteria bacterium]